MIQTLSGIIKVGSEEGRMVRVQRQVLVEAEVRAMQDHKPRKVHTFQELNHFEVLTSKVKIDIVVSLSL